MTQPTPPLFFQLGFRPFFLFAVLLAAVAVPLWMGEAAGLALLPAGLDGLAWHRHEMLFGFAAAAVSGFFLTAVPNWTGRAPIAGWLLVGLVGLWLLGRIGFFLSGTWPAWAVALTDGLYLPVLVCVVAREIIGGGNKRNLPVVGIFALFATGNLLLHAERLGWGEVGAAGERLGLFTIALLVGLIGGRVTPAFTGNWLKAKGETQLPVPFGIIDKAAIGGLVLTLAFKTAQPDAPWTAVLALLTGLALAGRLARWRTGATLADPLLAVLHLGYGWLALAFVLIGLAGLTEAIPESAALHALTTGAIATMIVAVSTRAALGHTGRPLVASPGTQAIYALITLAAVARVAAPFLEAGSDALLWISAAAWSLGFLLYLAVYFPVLTRPRVDGGGEGG